MSRNRPADEQRPVTVRHRIEYAAARTAAAVFLLIGARCTLAACAFFGRLAYWIDGRHRRIAIDNIERSGLTRPDGSPLSPEDVRRIAKGAFAHFVTATAEAVLVRREIKRRGFENVVHVEGLEHLHGALEGGRGAILITGHIGNWELMGVTCDRIEVDGTTIYRPLDNPLLDRWIRGVRGHTRQEMVPKRGALKGMLSGLKRGRLCALLIDQDARRHGVFVPFFGRPSSTWPTPAHLSLRTGADIITGFALRTGPGLTYREWFEPPVRVELTGDRDIDTVTITAEVTRRIEAAIRQAPEQWLWLHRRWKTAPPAAPPAAASVAADRKDDPA